MREIVFDTETTGLDPANGDRIVEIGCVELVNHVPTGRVYHQYLNPERSMSEEVIAVHGLTEQFLSDKPKFSEIADEFLAFIGSDSSLVAHNASFDMKFLNAELGWIGKQPLSSDRVIDTLLIAKKKFPGSRVNLDELCHRFNIDNSNRTVHGALLDSELLADVYLELLGGKEPGFILSQEEDILSSQSVEEVVSQKKLHPARDYPIPEEDYQNHLSFIQSLKDAMWLKEEKNDTP